MKELTFKKQIAKKYFSQSVIVLLLLLVLAISFFFFLLFNLNTIEAQRFEHYVSKFIQSFRTEQLTAFMKFFTKAGDLLGYIIIASVLSIILLIKRKITLLIQILIVIISSATLNVILKALIDRPRPYGNVLVRVNFNSFPSGHAVSSMAFYGFIIYLILKLSKNVSVKLLMSIFCFFMIMLIGLSRIYLGVHYPTDILAGYSSGFSYLIITILIIKYLEARKA